MYIKEKSMKNMSKKSSQISRRAWNILRLALLWARKGGIFRNRLVLSLNELGKGLRKLRHSDESHGALVYGDREFSFDETPIIHVKMYRPSSLRFKMPNIPCINPQVDFDYDFEFDDENVKIENDRRSCGLDNCNYLKRSEEELEEEERNDNGIDLKAEEFIAKFYEQMKLQRQISYLQYYEN